MTGEGKEVALSSFFGKPIVLNFWGTWCGYCKEELPGFLAAEREYGDQVQFLYLNYEQGASLEDSKKKTEEYLSQEGLEMTSYYDFQQDGGYDLWSIFLSYHLFYRRGRKCAGIPARLSFPGEFDKRHRTVVFSMRERMGK